MVTVVVEVSIVVVVVPLPDVVVVFLVVVVVFVMVMRVPVFGFRIDFLCWWSHVTRFNEVALKLKLNFISHIVSIYEKQN